MRRLVRQVVAALAALFALTFVAFVVSCVVALAIWPGQIELVAFLFCTDAQPDPFVVADTYNPRPGETVTNFTLYCMGPRGDATDQGFFFPFVAVTLLNGLVVTLLVLVVALWLRRRRSRRPADAAAAATPTPVRSPGSIVSAARPTASDEGFADEAPDAASDRRRERSSPPPGSTTGPFVD